MYFAMSFIWKKPCFRKSISELGFATCSMSGKVLTHCIVLRLQSYVCSLSPTEHSKTFALVQVFVYIQLYVIIQNQSGKNVANEIKHNFLHFSFLYKSKKTPPNKQKTPQKSATPICFYLIRVTWVITVAASVYSISHIIHSHYKAFLPLWF